MSLSLFEILSFEYLIVIQDNFNNHIKFYSIENLDEIMTMIIIISENCLLSLCSILLQKRLKIPEITIRISGFLVF